MEFWSPAQEEVAIADVAAPGTDTALPSVTVAGLPTGCTIIRAVAMFRFRAIENTHDAINQLQGAQDIQVDDAANTGWLSCISFVADQFTLAVSTREGYGESIGSADVKARVDGNDVYDFQWTAALVDEPNLQFNDVQMGLRIWYR
jgi:hypothetical protein